ncbi:MAG: hypothetical protein ACTSWG_08560, partial [Candidatus Helarchaeota archaeon]
PETHIKIMNKLIEEGISPCYSEIVRVALDRMIKRDLKILNKYNEKVMNETDEKKRKVKMIQKRMDDFVEFI